jgi:hypothetical protein
MKYFQEQATLSRDIAQHEELKNVVAERQLREKAEVEGRHKQDLDNLCTTHKQELHELTAKHNLEVANQYARTQELDDRCKAVLVS